VRDIHIPDPERVLMELHGAEVLEGNVVALTDDGLKADSFAVIEVDGLECSLVVPVDRLTGVP